MSVEDMQRLERKEQKRKEKERRAKEQALLAKKAKELHEAAAEEKKELLDPEVCPCVCERIEHACVCHMLLTWCLSESYSLGSSQV